MPYNIEPSWSNDKNWESYARKQARVACKLIEKKDYESFQMILNEFYCQTQKTESFAEILVSELRQANIYDEETFKRINRCLIIIVPEDFITYDFMMQLALFEVAAHAGEDTHIIEFYQTLNDKFNKITHIDEKAYLSKLKEEIFAKIPDNIKVKINSAANEDKTNVVSLTQNSIFHHDTRVSAINQTVVPKPYY
ncbi:MAG: hypothetical protein ACK4PR_10645 [Gammaproteobacteria bacterium]